LSCNFNNFVTLAKHKVKTVWRWCRCTETCRRAYGIENITYMYVVCALIGLDNELNKMHVTHIKILQQMSKNTQSKHITFSMWS